MNEAEEICSSFIIDKMRIVMSLTADIDVTNKKDYPKKNNMAFYPLMLWAVSKAIHSHDEFKYGWSTDGRLIK